jgi:quinol---cytochrome c reductase iron-sulfur subunit, bacillus type
VPDAADNRTSSSRANDPFSKPTPPGYFEGETMTRRAAFIVGGQAIAGAATVVVLLPVVGFAVAPIFDRPKERWEAVGSPDDFTADTYRQAVITQVEDVGDSGKTTVYIRKAIPEEPFNEEEGTFVAISTRCAHLGCPVRYFPSAGNFICPCHGGVYDFEGKVIGGPPVRPLDRFQTRISGGQVEVGPRYSVTSQLEPVRARDPGEFTGGIWEYLYPPRPTTPPPP